MKFKAKAGNTERLLFNDLNKITKGVSPDDRHVALNPGQSIYLPDDGSSYSAIAGDAHRYATANPSLLEINDTIAIGATVVLAHNFGITPTVSVVKAAGATWVAALVGTDYTATTDAAMNNTTIVNLSGVIIIVRIS